MLRKLRHGVPVLFRGNGEVQFGTDHKYGVILSGLSAAEEQYVGYLPRRFPHTKMAHYQQVLGISDHRVQEIFQQLDNAGVLDTGSLHTASASGAEQTRCARLDGSQVRYRRRRSHRVLVLGADRLGGMTAALLGNAGVGRINVITGMEAPIVSTADILPFPLTAVGQHRKHVVKTLCATFAPTTEYLPSPYYDVAILISYGAFSSALPQLFEVDHIPHLPVWITDMGVNVGPLIVPGVSACTRCLDLHRTATDPAWPTVSQQLQGYGLEKIAGSADAATISLAAGSITRLILDFIDARNDFPLGTGFYIPLYDVCPTQTFWQPHPDCSCHATT